VGAGSLPGHDHVMNHVQTCNPHSRETFTANALVEGLVGLLDELLPRGIHGLWIYHSVRIQDSQEPVQIVSISEPLRATAWVVQEPIHPTAATAAPVPKDSFEKITRRMLGTKMFPRTEKAESFKRMCRKAFNLGRR
jgi:hypothetical protein